ncbi:MAG: hypothetical protein RR490_07920 [Niameybacter sp.]
MNTSSLIAIWLPILVIFFIILPSQNHRNILMKQKRKKVKLKLTNEMLKKYIGVNCTILTGSFGNQITGTILDVQENWIEVATKKGNQLFNADFVINIIQTPIKK